MWLGKPFISFCRLIILCTNHQAARGLRGLGSRLTFLIKEGSSYKFRVGRVLDPSRFYMTLETSPPGGFPAKLDEMQGFYNNPHNNWTYKVVRTKNTFHNFKLYNTETILSIYFCSSLYRG
jgi:hypothetical protein